MSRRISSLLWGITLLCVFLFVAELWSREKFADVMPFNGVRDLRLPAVLVTNHPELGYQFVPNATHFFSSVYDEFQVNYHINELGLRDSGMLTSGPKQPMVLTLGGATVEGYGVMRDASFTLEMQRQLRFQKGVKRFPRILGAGITGYGAAQNYLLGKRLIKELQPDLVVFLYSSLMPVYDYRFLKGASLDDDGFALGAPNNFAAPIHQPVSAGLMDKIKLVQLVKNHFQLRKSRDSITPGDQSSDFFAAARDVSESSQKLHERSLKHVAALADIANANGLDFVFVHMPLAHQVAADEWSIGRYRNRIDPRLYEPSDPELFREICAKQNAHCFDATNMFRKLASTRSSRVFFDYDHALTEVGHRALVDFLIDPIRELLGHPIPE